MLEIEYLPVASLNGAPYNPRKMPDEQMQRLMRGIEEFGVVDPIIVNQRTCLIVGGHQRVEAAKRLGLETVPVVHVNLDPERERALNLALNKISGEWDVDALKGILGELNDAVLDLDLTGFSDDEIAALLDEGPLAVALGDPDDAPEVDEAVEPITKPGDLIVLGRHRLLCGDSTSLADLERLMGGGLADLVWTDPPYGVSYEGKTKDALTIENDDLTEGQLESFLTDALGNAAENCRAGAAWYVAAPAGPLHLVFAQVLHRLGIWRQTINWVKNTFALGRSDYHYRHEPIFYGWKPGAGHYFVNDRTQDSIWEFDKPSRNGEHPTMKPVPLIERAINNSSKKGEVVLDPFGGSGSTLIACEGTGRDCRTMDLDPRYCDVIVARWEKFTGGKAKRPRRR